VEQTTEELEAAKGRGVMGRGGGSNGGVVQTGDRRIRNTRRRWKIKDWVSVDLGEGKKVFLRSVTKGMIKRGETNVRDG